jgi:hypothetical protein
MTLETAVSLKDLEAQDRARPSHPPTDRRREPRYPTNDPAKIRSLEAWDDPVRFAGTVLDVSRNGMRVEVMKSLPIGIRVEVILIKASVFGEIRYCRRVSLAYHVGIAIEDVFFPPSTSFDHIHDDQLSLYVAGKGLKASETIRMQSHLRSCTDCRTRLVEAETVVRVLRKCSSL